MDAKQIFQDRLTWPQPDWLSAVLVKRHSSTEQGTMTFSDSGVRVDLGGEAIDYPTCDDLPGC